MSFPIKYYIVIYHCVTLTPFYIIFQKFSKFSLLDPITLDNAIITILFLRVIKLKKKIDQ